MIREGERPSIPSAPQALREAVIVSENKTYPNDHEATIASVTAILNPLLDALSIPEVYTRNTTKLDGMPLEDLWRRTLDFAVEVRTEEKPDFPYFVYAVQIVDEEGNARTTVFEASAYAPDEIPIASMGPDRNRGDILLVRNARREIAFKNELSDIEDLARFLATESPRQAVEKGRISPHWMERWNMKDVIDPNCTEGFPPQPTHAGKSKLYEVVQWNGIRRICTVKDSGGILKWNEDIRGEVQVEEGRVAAWRELGNILPEYYKREKYPSLYQSKTTTPPTL
jgi:hypothetical protein